MGNDMKRYDGKNHAAGSNTAPYPSSRLAPGIDIVDLAREISKADTMIHTTTSNRLRDIAAQIQRLQQDARQILEQAQRDQQLHRASCHFKRQPGRIYHLYKKKDGQLYFSMLSPLDWSDLPPHSYQGSYRLEADMTWTDIQFINNLDEKNSAVKHLLSTLPLPE